MPERRTDEDTPVRVVAELLRCVELRVPTTRRFVTVDERRTDEVRRALPPLMIDVRRPVERLLRDE